MIIHSQEVISHPLFSFEEKGQLFTLKIAETMAEKLEAFGLIYDIYCEKDFVKPNSEKLWYSIFDASPSSTTLVIKNGGVAVGCLTMILDSIIGLPADELFKPQVNQLRANSQKIVEIVSLGIKKDVRGISKIFKKLFDINLYLSYFIHGAKDCIITVNPSHVPFYEKRMGFEKASNAKRFSKVNGAPAVLMQINGHQILNDSDGRFFKDDFLEKIKSGFDIGFASKPLRSQDFLNYFSRKWEFFKRNKSNKIAYFQSIYPQIMFDGANWLKKVS